MAEEYGISPVKGRGSLRGRARGVGSEFLLALDIRFASREKAIFCQPEIGFGFFPGDGGLERLPLVTGRSRAMEIILGGEDFAWLSAARLAQASDRTSGSSSASADTRSSRACGSRRMPSSRTAERRQPAR